MTRLDLFLLSGCSFIVAWELFKECYRRWSCNRRLAQLKRDYPNVYRAVHEEKTDVKW